MKAAEPHPASAINSWVRQLSDVLDPSWRPEEWNAEALLFTGLLDTSVTAAYSCSTPNCGEPARTLNQPCSSCRDDLAAFPGDPAVFRRPDTPTKGLRHSHYPICQVVNNGQRCGRTENSHGLCRSHRSLWIKHFAGKVSRVEFLTDCVDVYPRRADCIVSGCPHEQVIVKWQICEPHHTQLTAYSTGLHLPRPQIVERFLASARPPLKLNQISMIGMHRTLVVELLYVLQQRDRMGYRMDPTAVRALQLSCGRRSVTSLLDFSDQDLEALGTVSTQCRALIRSARLLLTRLQVKLGIVDAMQGDVWDVAVLNLVSGSERKFPAVRGTLDFTVLTIPWIKQVTKEWVRQTEPDVESIRNAIQAAVRACRTLAIRKGGHRPDLLGLPDMSAIFREINEARRPDGSKYSSGQRNKYWVEWRKLVNFGRVSGLMSEIPGTFATLPAHKVKFSEQNEESSGKAIPPTVIAVLDAHLADFRPTKERIIGDWTCTDFSLMYQTMYLIFRNTGRRLTEVMSLRRNCLQEKEAGQFFLIYSNHKEHRLNRWLPIDESTAVVIRRWHEHVGGLDVIKDLRTWLFPSPGAQRVSRAGHFTGSSFVQAFNAWRSAIPSIPDVGIDSNGEPREFDRSLIHTHAFRHTYAQRHADAGTQIDILASLMDHKSIATTMGYYKVSLKRRTEAVKTVGALAIDREGRGIPDAGSISYQRTSVAVPFGNCTEPANVKAGGEACPVRFQCGGCNYYRPDPSFMPAIEEHIAKLRGEMEAAMLIGAADWIVRNLDEQIQSFKAVLRLMDNSLKSLDAEQRAAIDEASAVMRKTRAARTFIPLAVVDRKSQPANG